MCTAVWLRQLRLPLSILMKVGLGGWLAVSVFGYDPAGVRAAESGGGREVVWRETFDLVWRTVKEKHFDTNRVGVAWDRVRVEYGAKLVGVKSDEELHQLLGRMLGELGQTHFSIVSPEAVPNHGLKEPTEGVVGVDVSLSSGEVVVTRVKPGSPAARAGVRPGHVLRSVDGHGFTEGLKSLAGSRLPDGLKPLLGRRLVLSKLNGAAGTSLELVMVSPDGRVRAVRMVRERLRGEMSLPLGNFPPQYTEFETRMLPGRVAYIRFNIWVVSQMEKIRTAIRSQKDARGLILDLRGNPGGIAGMAMGATGLMVQTNVSLGTMKMRAGEIYFACFPQPGAFTGPVVVLVDGSSASTSEIFAAGLQELGRAVVVGERTAGAALPSMFQELPTGALFQFAFGDFKTPQGRLVEGEGVMPDRLTPVTAADLWRGHDRALETALLEIRKRRR